MGARWGHLGLFLGVSMDRNSKLFFHIAEALRLGAADRKVPRQSCSPNHACPRWGNCLQNFRRACKSMISTIFTLGSLLVYEDDFGAILRSLRHHFWHVKATLESLFAYDDDFVATLGSLCGQFSHLRAALGTLWGHFGSTCGIWG